MSNQLAIVPAYSSSILSNLSDKSSNASSPAFLVIVEPIVNKGFKPRANFSLTTDSNVNVASLTFNLLSAINYPISR